MRSIKFMLSGVFLVLVSIFIMAMMVILWVDTGIAAQTSGFHAILIFVPFIGGVVLFIIGLLTKSPSQG